jgi:hypothetical protein
MSYIVLPKPVVVSRLYRDWQRLRSGKRSFPGFSTDRDPETATILGTDTVIVEHCESCHMSSWSES